MKTIHWVILLIAVAGMGVWGWYDDFSNKSEKQEPVLSETMVILDTPTKENCLADECLLVEDIEYPVAELPGNLIEALDKAIDDEYKAKSTYDAVIAKFGLIKPFSQIVRAEEQHISSLKSIYDKYGIEIPENKYESNIEAPDTLQASCALGVQAEIANVALYKDQLLPVVFEYPDISSVFTNLMDASRDKHLPAFENCQ